MYPLPRKGREIHRDAAHVDVMELPSQEGASAVGRWGRAVKDPAGFGTRLTNDRDRLDGAGGSLLAAAGSTWPREGRGQGAGRGSAQAR